MPFPRACLPVLAVVACSAPPPAPMLPLPRPFVGAFTADPAPATFEFLVGGHLYGDPGVDDHRPSATLRAAAPALAMRGARFFVSLGDLVQRFDDVDLALSAADLQALRLPVFNAPGNHEYGDPARFRARYGDGYGCFVHGGALFVLLNTEIVPWHIADRQLAFLRAAFASADAGVRHVFVFGHKNIFAVGEPRYRALLEHGNALDGFVGRSNFRVDVLPALRALARSHDVFWFSGDVGAPQSLGLFHERDPATGITYVAIGLGDAPRDSLLAVHVEPAGVRLELVPLGAAPVALDACGPEHWQAAFR